MKKNLINLAIKFTLTIAVCFPVFLNAQNTFESYPLDSTKIYKIEMNDGSEFVGNFLQRNSTLISIKTASIPKIDLPIKEITKISEVATTDFNKGVYWFPNPNSTRYLFGPSAFNLKKGEGYYQNTYIFLNSFNVGVSSNISIGGGLEFLSTFGEGKPIFYVTPKVTFKITDNLRVGSGFIYLSIPELGINNDKRVGSGVVYGISSYGSADHNFTVGMGWGFLEGDFKSKPVITISGMTRIARKAALITENWFIPDDNYGFNCLFSYGIRFFGEKIAVDLAFINNADIAENIAIGIPCVNFVVKF
jgi:hypothetical protein